MKKLDAINEESCFRNKIIILGFLLSLMVVLIHAYNAVEFSYIIPRWFSRMEFLISEDIGPAAPVLFFMISGFLFFRTFRSFSKENVKYKYISRLKSLVVPYLIWNAFATIVYYFATKTGVTNGEAFELTFVNIFNGIVLYKYNLPFWFMYQLIICVIIFPLIYFLLKNKWVGFISIILLSVINCFFLTNIFTIIISCVCYFMIGSLMALHFEKYVSRPKNYMKYIAIILGFLSQVFFYLKIRYQYEVYNYLYLIFLAIGIFYIFDFIKVQKTPSKMFNCSFIIFACHSLLLETVQKCLRIVLPINTVTIIIDYLGSAIITVVLICIFSLILRKIFPKVYSILSGGR